VRLWEAVTRLAGELEDNEETQALAVASRLQQLDYAWRLGMEREEAARLQREAEEIAKRIGDLRSLALLKVLSTATPGVPREAGPWLDGVEEAKKLARESGDRQLQIAISAAGSYVHLATADFERLDRAADETLEMADGDRSAGMGIILGSPIAWSMMAKGMARREWGEVEESERWLADGLRVAEEVGDTETASWIRGTTAQQRALQGDTDGAVALARRNCELTERLGDVFSRSLALANYAATLVQAGDFSAAVDAIEEAETIYREAMGSGGEMEAWRGAIRAEALIGAGRADEAVEVAEWVSKIARERGIRWPLPLTLLALGRARAAAGRPGAEEALDEGVAVATETGAVVTRERLEAQRDALAAGAL
jgi:tetratricopeptide (TPR) repeat protein